MFHVEYCPGVTLQRVEREWIESALKYYNGNKRKTAKALGVSTKTLYNKLHQYGIFKDWSNYKSPLEVINSNVVSLTRGNANE